MFHWFTILPTAEPLARGELAVRACAPPQEDRITPPNERGGLSCSHASAAPATTWPPPIPRANPYSQADWSKMQTRWASSIVREQTKPVRGKRCSRMTGVGGTAMQRVGDYPTQPPLTGCYDGVRWPIPFLPPFLPWRLRRLAAATDEHLSTPPCVADNRVCVRLYRLCAEPSSCRCGRQRRGTIF